MHDITSYLFETNAVKICPNEKPFWYTSGKIGPYFINAQFLYGSEEDANSFLNFIDEQLENTPKTEIPKNLFTKVKEQFDTNSIYQDVILQMKDFILKNIDINEVDYISGGERRDWYFSNIIAYLLEKPHITIFKDLSIIASNFDFTENKEVTKLEGKHVLHIADLLNQASSYIRAWIPAIQNLGAEILWSTVAVDRMQGGTERLQDLGIKSFAMVKIDPYLFQKALELNLINETQLEMLNKFYEKPDETMREFLINHPSFLEEALHSDSKTAKRAKLCVDGNLYNL